MSHFNFHFWSFWLGKFFFKQKGKMPFFLLVLVVTVEAFPPKQCSTSFGDNCSAITVRFYTRTVTFNGRESNCSNSDLNSIPKNPFLEQIKPKWVQLLGSTLQNNEDLTMFNRWQ